MHIDHMWPGLLGKFPNLKNENNSTYFTRLLWGVNELTHAKRLQLCLHISNRCVICYHWSWCVSITEAPLGWKNTYQLSLSLEKLWGNSLRTWFHLCTVTPVSSSFNHQACKEPSLVEKSFSWLLQKLQLAPPSNQTTTLFFASFHSQTTLNIFSVASVIDMTELPLRKTNWHYPGEVRTWFWGLCKAGK